MKPAFSRPSFSCARAADGKMGMRNVFNESPFKGGFFRIRSPEEKRNPEEKYVYS